MHRAVFLDRDGVINRAIVRKGKPYPPASLAELELLPGVPEALLRLHTAGFQLIIVTNQPDVARGTTTRTEVEAIHHGLQFGGAGRPPLHIDRFQVCYHDDSDGCNCRKPAPGLLLDAAREDDLDLTTSFMVGDRWRDIEAGRRAGCTTLFIDYGYDEAERSPPDARFRSLAEAADWILNDMRRATI